MACGLSTCANKWIAATTDMCFCDNSIYIACENMDDMCYVTVNSNEDSVPALAAQDGCADDPSGGTAYTDALCYFTNPVCDYFYVYANSH